MKRKRRSFKHSYLYHITFYNRLASIVENGLRPNNQRSIGGPAYDSHAEGSIFFTVLDGVYFWMNRAEDFAEHNSDNAFEDGLVPIVLRIDVLAITQTLMFGVDQIGTRDALADALMTSNVINSSEIEIYDGDDWSPISGYDYINIEDAFYTEEVLESDEDEPTTLYYFKTESPFLPPEAAK